MLVLLLVVVLLMCRVRVESGGGGRDRASWRGVVCAVHLVGRVTASLGRDGRSEAAIDQHALGTLGWGAVSIAVDGLLLGWLVRWGGRSDTSGIGSLAGKELIEASCRS